MITELNDITDLQQILKDHRQPGQKIFHQCLCTKAHSNTENTRTSQKWHNIDTNLRQNHHKRQ